MDSGNACGATGTLGASARMAAVPQKPLVMRVAVATPWPPARRMVAAVLSLLLLLCGL